MELFMPKALLSRAEVIPLEDSCIHNKIEKLGRFKGSFHKKPQVSY